MRRIDELLDLEIPPFVFQKDSKGKMHISGINTLQDVIRTYMARTSIWLLGYDARIPVFDQKNDKPLRSQDSENPWLTAYSCSNLVEARSILEHEYPEIANEIERKVINTYLANGSPGAIHWLLEPRRSEWPVRSDSLVYDTSITILALLKTYSMYGNLGLDLWEDDFEKRVWDSIVQLSQWLETKLNDKTWVIFDLSKTGGQHIGRSFEAIAFFNNKFPSRFEEAFQLEHFVFRQTTEIVMRFLQTRTSEDGGKEEISSMSSINRELFKGLSDLISYTGDDFLNWMGIGDEFHIVIKLLEFYIQWYEESNIGRLVGGFASGSRNLAIYAHIDEILNKRLPERRRDYLSELIIWAGFRRLIGRENWYPNGSIYDNSIMETIWFLGCLNSLYKWSGSTKEVIEFYDQSFYDLTNIPMIERELTYQLRERIVDLESEKDKLTVSIDEPIKKLRRTRTIYTIVSFFIVIVYLIVFILPKTGVTSPIINPEFYVIDLQSAIALVALLLPGAIAIPMFLFSLLKD